MNILQNKQKMKKRKILLLGLLSFVIILLLTGRYIFKHYYNLMDIQQKEELSSKQALHEETEEETEDFFSG